MGIRLMQYAGYGGILVLLALPAIGNADLPEWKVKHDTAPGVDRSRLDDSGGAPYVDHLNDPTVIRKPGGAPTGATLEPDGSIHVTIEGEDAIIGTIDVDDEKLRDSDGTPRVKVEHADKICHLNGSDC